MHTRLKLLPSLEMMIQTTLSPLAESDKQPRRRSGEEAGLLLQGQLHLTIESQEFELSSGDSFSIAKDEAHHIRNPSPDEDAVVLWVITPPVY